MENRVLPHNIEAEQAVLGAMMIDNDAAARALEILTADDFYSEAHKIIFSVVSEMYGSKKGIDLVMVVEALKKMNKLEDVGGIAYVTSVLNSVVTAANLTYHAEIVLDKSMLRKIIKVGTEMVSMGYEGNDEARVVLDKVESKVLDIGSRKNRISYQPIRAVLMDNVNKLEQFINNKCPFSGIPSGFNDFDRLTGGLNPSDFIILASRPSMGKTALALNIAQNVALRAHKRVGGEPRSVAIFSLGMSREQVVNRMLCSESNVDSLRLRSGDMNDKDWDSLWAASSAFAASKIYIDDTAGLTVMDLRTRARRIKAEHGLDLIIVDYLQLLQGSSKRYSYGERYQELSDISKALKALASELNVPLIALSQLSRSVEQRQMKRPLLSDLSESGALEQDADIVAFLYREDYYDPETERKHTELIVAKHRNGPVDTVNLFFHKQFVKFMGFTKRED